MVFEHAAPIFLPFLLYRVQHLPVDRLQALAAQQTAQKDNILLSPEMREKILLGRMKLTALARMEVLASVIRPGTCNTNNVCNAARLIFLSTLTKVDGFIDPLPKYRPHQYLCSQCATAVAADMDAGRAKVWDQLPRIFGLPTWEELRSQTFIEAAKP